MAQPMMSGPSDRKDGKKANLEGSHPFEQEVKVVGPDVNMGHTKMTAPSYELGGKNPKNYSK